jgi:hypothetical protein
MRGTHVRGYADVPEKLRHTPNPKARWGLSSLWHIPEHRPALRSMSEIQTAVPLAHSERRNTFFPNYFFSGVFHVEMDGRSAC